MYLNNKTPLLILLLVTLLGCARAQNTFADSTQPTTIPDNILIVPMPVITVETDLRNDLAEYQVKYTGSDSILAQRLSRDDIGSSVVVKKKQVEKLALPNLAVQGETKHIQSNRIIASRIFDDGVILAFMDKLEVYDSKLSLLQTMVYPKESFIGKTPPDVAISPDGKFTLVDGSLWNRMTGQWVHGLKAPFTSAEIVMGNNAAVINDYRANETWVINYNKPTDIKTFKTKHVKRIDISPDGKRIFVENDGPFPKRRLIDVESGKTLSTWRGEQHFVSINWTYNRLITDDRKLYQLYPKKFITDTSHCAINSYFLEAHPLAVCIEEEDGSGKAGVFNVIDGSMIFEDELLSPSGERMAFIPYLHKVFHSKDGFTLLMDAGNGKIQPYQLQINN